MSNIAVQRIQKEIKEVLTSEEIATIGIKIEPVGDDNMKMKGEIKGPPDTPYQAGIFRLSIDIPDNYPFQPPKVKFLTKLWHPNISSVTGVICLDVLKDQWAASMTLRTVLLSIQSLLSDPQPNDPQDAVVAKQYLDNLTLFKKTAKYWAQIYARAPGELDKDMKKRVDQVAELCRDPEKALVALSHCEWDVAKATERIFQ